VEWLDITVLSLGSRYVSSEKISTEFNIPLSQVLKIPYTDLNDKFSEESVYKSAYLGGTFIIDSTINKVNPDIVISLNDTEPLKRQYMVLSPENKKRFIPYVPIDAGDIPESWLVDFGKIITMTQFGKTEIQKLYPDTKVWVLPHGMDSSSVHPISNIGFIRERNGIPLNAFVVGCINANHVRKRFDLLVEAFCKFSVCKNDTFLLIKTNSAGKRLKTNSISPFKDYDLNVLIKTMFSKYEIKLDRYKIVEGFVNNKIINNIYNCCDVGVTTTSGEGFGLTPCEMSLCGIPQLVPEYSSFPEIFGPNYYGLIKTEVLPHFLVRDSENLPDWYDNKFICILKSFPHYQHKTSEHYHIDISDNIPSVLISNQGVDQIGVGNCDVFNSGIMVIDHFKTLEYAVKFYNTMIKQYQPIQIIISCQLDYLLTQLDSVLNLKSQIPIDDTQPYNHLFTTNTYIRELVTSDFGTAGIPSVNDTVNKLDQLYHDTNLRSEMGSYCKDRIKTKFNIDKIVEMTKDAIINISSELN